MQSPSDIYNLVFDTFKILQIKNGGNIYVFADFIGQGRGEVVRERSFQ